MKPRHIPSTAGTHQKLLPVLKPRCVSANLGPRGAVTNDWYITIFVLQSIFLLKKYLRLLNDLQALPNRSSNAAVLLLLGTLLIWQKKMMRLSRNARKPGFGFPNRSDTNRPVQHATVLKLCLLSKRGSALSV